MTTAAVTKNDAATRLFSLISVHPYECHAVEQCDYNQVIVSVLGHGVVHQVVSEGPNREDQEDGVTRSEATYRQLQVTPETTVTIRTKRGGDGGEHHTWRFDFGDEKTLCLAGDWESAEHRFASELFAQIAGVQA